MDSRYQLLAVKEEMWAKMLMQVLADHHIPCTALPVHGAGFVIKTGMQEEMMVYVPDANLPKAKELLEELFSEDSIRFE